MLAIRPPITLPRTTVSAALLEELVGEIPLLASVYHKPAETFVGRGRISADSMQRKSEYVLISIFRVSAPDKPPTGLLMSVHRHKRHSRRSLRARLRRICSTSRTTRRTTDSRPVSRRQPCSHRRLRPRTCSRARRATRSTTSSPSSAPRASRPPRRRSPRSRL